MDSQAGRMRRKLFDSSSPAQWAILTVPFAILLLANQFVTVVPYPNRERDKLLVDVVYVALMLSFSARAALLHHRQRVRERRRQSGQCELCGYDLRASGSVCPECGGADRTAAGRSNK